MKALSTNTLIALVMIILARIILFYVLYCRLLPQITFYTVASEPTMYCRDGVMGSFIPYAPARRGSLSYTVAACLCPHLLHLRACAAILRPFSTDGM